VSARGAWGSRVVESRSTCSMARSDSEEDSPGRYRMGQDQDGTFAVTVTTDGYASETNEYEVTADQCHVMALDETVELTPSP
jgi:hypothetical protein